MIKIGEVVVILSLYQTDTFYAIITTDRLGAIGVKGFYLKCQSLKSKIQESD